MGCTSTVAIEQRRILSLPQETVNSYIDKFPAITLQKIKQKFFNLSDKQTKDISYFNFLKLYSVCKLNNEVMMRLFQFFNDHRRENLKFKQFMSKYAIITKCESHILYKILFEIYKNNEDIDVMSAEQFQNFAKIQEHFLKKTPMISQPTITQQQFIQTLEQTGFKVIEYQNQLIITNQEDIPFQTINRQLQECDFNDYINDTWYYLLSNSWYNRWSFYYQQINHSIDRSHIKSTKMLPSDNNVMSVRRRKKRQNLNDSKRTNQSFIRSSQIGTALIQQPNTINFDEIQGQYKGQLKQSLKTSAQIKVITENLWHLLCTLHPPEQQFKRIALNQDTIEYYPKSIYYLEANRSGQILLESQSIKQLSMAKPVLSIFSRYDLLTKKQKFGVFTKNFYQKNWREIGINKIGTDISLDPRFFVVFAEDRQKFIENNFRKQITIKNIDIGDRVFAYFPYVKTHSQAVIISRCEDEKFKLHFKGYSYKYQIEVIREEISIAQADAAISSSKKKNQSLIKGISNIGNTCFMNAVIESLVATPVLDQFLNSFPFDQKKHPIGYGLSLIAKSLLKNQKPYPQAFKKLIDVHMPLFSGFDQHDAQQFLNILLDKISQEIEDKPTVIDYLFGGKAQSKLTCSCCKKVKIISQNMYILSLPLPQAEYNVYSIIVVSSSSTSMKKIIFKLHKDSTISDYLNIFQQKTGENKKDFVFCEMSNNSLKKIKNQLLHPSYQKKKVTDMGIVPNISLVAYERIPSKLFYQLLRGKKQNQYRDYKTSQAYWTVCKIGGKTDTKDKIALEYLNQQNEFEKIKIDKNSSDKLTENLGSQTTQHLFRKLILRKYNPSLKKLQFFGTQFLIGIPRWASYNDLIIIVQQYISNLKNKQAKLSKKDEKGDYLIRLLDPSKNKCIFCSKQTPMFSIDQSDLQYCCDAFDKDIPLPWASKGKSYWIYIDWINFSNCNSSYCMYLQVDPVSKNVQLSRQQEQINLEDCIKLYNEPENVQMECDSCKEKYQKLEHLIGSMPNILIVHMKEFRYTPQGHLIKLDLRLKWQQILDSSKFALTTQGKLYQLFSVVRHSGTSQSGHYTCVAKRKHPFENKKVWINFDDDISDLVKQQQKFIDDAYLLFYKKVDMPTSSLVIYSDLNSK